MSQFKILKGESSRISIEETQFHEGWLYYCTDTKKLYVDVDTGGKQDRVLLNPDSSSAGKTFLWGDLLGGKA